MGDQGQILLGQASPLAIGGVTVANVATRQFDAAQERIARDPVAGLDIWPRKVYAEELVLTNFLQVGDGVTIQDRSIISDMIQVDSLSALSANLGTVRTGQIVVGTGGILITTEEDGTGERTELAGDGLIVYDSSGNAKTLVNTKGLSIRNASGADPGVQERLSLADSEGNEFGQLFYDNASHTVNLLSLQNGADGGMAIEAYDLIEMAGARIMVQGSTSGEISTPALDIHHPDGAASAADVTLTGDLTVYAITGATNGTITADGDITSAADVNADNVVATTDVSGATFTGGAATMDSYSLTDGVVHINAYVDNGPTLTDNTLTTLVFNNEVEDTGSDYNPATGEFTVPANGYYLINAGYLSASTSWTIDDVVGIEIDVDGSTVVYGDRIEWEATITAYARMRVTAVLKLTANQVVTVKGIMVRGANTALYNGSNEACYNYLTIDRLLA